MSKPDIPNVPGLTEVQMLSLAYCRTLDQYVNMLESSKAGKCVFCDPLGPQNRVVQEDAGWRIWPNPFPIKFTEHHFVMAPRRHVVPGDAIQEEDFLAMGRLFRWAQQEYQFTGGGFVMRFGGPLQSAGSVLHLHANIIIPNRQGAVGIPLAKNPKKVAQQIARMMVFEKLRTGALFNRLTPAERTLVKGRVSAK